MWFVFSGAEWYADTAALPRYCGNPASTLTHLRKILLKETPPDIRAKRPYVVAAKLIFLVPRRDDEPLEAYLARVQAKIDRACRVAS